MIRLKRIEIHVNEEFQSPEKLNEFKRKLTTAIAAHMSHPPTVYNTFETHENLIIKAEKAKKN